MSKKIQLGQFFTGKDLWLKPHILEFIKNSSCKIIYDPFAGKGDLLEVMKRHGYDNAVGLDIDDKLSWKINDSLKKIPTIKNAIIITNPPYLAKQSAARKKIDIKNYFINSPYDDIYLIALERMLEAQSQVVAIIPESFINSNFKQKSKLSSITILEENPFYDTENPVCVVCFDGIEKDNKLIKVYKNTELAGNFQEIMDVRIFPHKNLKMKFNSKDGWLALRAVDSTDDNLKIHFAFKKDIPYDWENGIKVSSRHMTLIHIDLEDKQKHALIKEANSVLQHIRTKSQSILLTPFMGNTKKGIRRRRLDYDLARAILEKAYEKAVPNSKGFKINIFD